MAQADRDARRAETLYLADARRRFREAKTQGEGALGQVPFELWSRRLDAGSNSLATLVLHIAGNQLSRWTDFLTSDGEKPDRNRDGEFEDAALTHEELLARWERGWDTLFETLAGLRNRDLTRIVTIRAESMAVLEAINRQLAHYSLHVGQMVFLAKHLAGESWRSQSIPRARPAAPPATADDLADLDIAPSALRAMLDATSRRVIDHLATLPSQPARGDVKAEALCRALREPAPESGQGLDELLRLLFDDCIPRSFTTAGPGYLAYIPGGGLPAAALADLIADTTNRYTGVWTAAPALVQLEANALDWLRDWMSFPAAARGLFTTGGSMANFNAVVCAREKHLGSAARDGVAYASTEVHHSVLKAARLAGVFPDRVRAIGVDADYRMRVDVLREAIERDRHHGLKPFLVVSTAGTTNTGAVDPLHAVADVCSEQGLWHHVDGAYGAFFHACPELRPLLPGLSRADSLTLDPHKGLFLPYGTGALLVRDGADLRAAHAGEHPTYLPDLPDPDEFYDPASHGPDLSRGFPGLRVWLCVKLYGAARLRAAIAEKRQLALEAAAAIGGLPGVRMVAPPQLSLFAFHLTWPGATPAAEDAATTELLERVTARGRVMMTGCRTRGRFLARVCVLSFRTRRERMQEAIEQIGEESRRLLPPS